MATSDSPGLPPFRVLGLSPQTVDYRQTWDLQRELHRQVLEGSSRGEVMLLEHTAVYTAGKRTDPKNLPDDDAPVVWVDRGGQITWHGPGQLICYPVVQLVSRAAVKEFVWFLEEVIIRTVAEYGVEASRVEGRSGVWVLAGTDEDGTAREDRKIAAIGLRVQRGVVTHGFALNCSNSLEPYEHIIACGIEDAGITTISIEAGREVTPAEIVPIIQRHFTELAPGLLAPADTDPAPATSPTPPRHLEGNLL